MAKVGFEHHGPWNSLSARKMLSARAVALPLSSIKPTAGNIRSVLLKSAGRVVCV